VRGKVISQTHSRSKTSNKNAPEIPARSCFKISSSLILRMHQAKKLPPRRRRNDHLILRTHNNRRPRVIPARIAQNRILLQCKSRRRNRPRHHRRIRTRQKNPHRRRPRGLNHRQQTPKPARQRKIAPHHRSTRIVLSNRARDRELPIAARPAAPGDLIPINRITLRQGGPRRQRQRPGRQQRKC